MDNITAMRRTPRGHIQLPPFSKYAFHVRKGDSEAKADCAIGWGGFPGP